MEGSALVKSVGIKYGLILGIVSIALFMVGVAINNPQFGGMWLGLIILIAGIAIAHQEYKRKGSGFMSYGTGLGIGTLVAAVSAVISAIFGYVYMKFIDQNYMENMRQLQVEELQKQGLSDEQIDGAMDMMSGLATPEMILVFGILGGIFFGFIISLIVSAFTKNNNPELSV